MFSSPRTHGTRPALLAVAVAASLVLAGCGDSEKGASQTAAKVNKEEITVHQINFVLQQQRGLKPDQADAAAQKVLEGLIDQELAVQRAGDLELDRSPAVVQQLQAAHRAVLAQAYAERVGAAATQPSEADIKKYYEDNPALFAERRIYSLQEVSIETPEDKIPALRAKLAEAKNLNEFVEYLKAEGIRFTANQAVRAAEQLPLASVKGFAAMKDGQAVFSLTPEGARVIVLAGSRAQPVTLEQARGAVERFLLNERKRELIAKDREALRKDAAIEYVGKFAQAASAAAASASAAPTPVEPSAPAATPEPAPAAPAPAASAALDAESISKGLGLK